MPKKGGKSKGKNKVVHKDKYCPKVEEGDDSLYAKVIKLLGSCRMTVVCSDTQERLAHVRGSLQKRSWISVGDVVLVSLRTFQTDKCDIVYKYHREEVLRLVKDGEIPSHFSNCKKTGDDSKDGDAPKEDGFVFDDEIDIDIEKI